LRANDNVLNVCIRIDRNQFNQWVAILKYSENFVCKRSSNRNDLIEIEYYSLEPINTIKETFCLRS